MKFSELIEWFIGEMNGTGGALPIKPLGESHLFCLRRLQCAPIADIEVQDLDRADWIDHVKLRRRAVKAATAMHDITFARGVLKYAASARNVKEGITEASIVAAMPVLQKHGLVGKSTPRTRRPTHDEEERLLAFLEAQDARDGTKIKVAPCVRFALRSTRRRGEICRLQWGDIDFEREVYLIRDMKHPTKKKGNHKTFALFPELAEIIRAQPRLSDDPAERVFPYNDKSLGARYTLAKKALGIEDLRFHDNRREAITRWLEILPPHKVRQISGHENTIILERVYAAPRPEDLGVEVAKLRAGQIPLDKPAPNALSLW
jgi:integrase